MKHVILALSALLLTACGGSAGGGEEVFPTSPYGTFVTQVGALSIAVRTAPTQPPTRGILSVEYDITDPGGRALDDLHLTVEPWMPAMGHGASVEPTVEPLGGGRYHIGNLALFMPGRWQLRTEIKGAESDHVDIDLDIQ